MSRTIVTLVAALATSSMMMLPAPAQAKNGVNAAIAAGAVGGLALGAIIASRPAYAAPAYGGPVYIEDQPECFVVRDRVWTGFRWRIVRHTVCE